MIGLCKKIGSALLLIIFTVSIVGCSKTEYLYGEKEESPEERASDYLNIDNSSIIASLNSTPQHISFTLGELININADVSIPILTSNQTLFAHKATWSVDALTSTFNVDEPVEKVGTGTFASSTYKLASGNGYIGFGTLSFSPQLYETFLKQSFDEGNLIESHTQVDLSFLTSLDAESLVRQKCLQLQISLSKESFALPLSAEILNKEANKTRQSVGEDQGPQLSMNNKDYYRVYSSEDEAYLIMLRQQYNKIPFTSFPYQDVKSDRYFPGTLIRGYVKREGIVDFYGGEIYSDIYVSDSTDRIVPIDVAIDNIARKFGGIIGNDSITINSIALEYVARPIQGDTSAVKLILAWTFITDSVFPNGSSVVFVDTNSGEVF